MTQYVPLTAVLRQLAAVPHIQAEMRRHFADLVCVPEGQSAEWLRTYDYNSHELRAAVRRQSEHRNGDAGHKAMCDQQVLRMRAIFDSHAASQPEPNTPPEFQAWLATHFRLREAFTTAVEASVEEREEATLEMNAAHTTLLEHSHKRPSAAFLREPNLGLDTPLPCDVTVGGGTMRQGVTLSTLVLRMKMLHEAAFPPEPPEALVEALRLLQKTKQVLDDPKYNETIAWLEQNTKTRAQRVAEFDAVRALVQDEPVAPAVPSVADDVRAIRTLLERVVEGDNVKAEPLYTMEVVSERAVKGSTRERIVTVREAHRTGSADEFFAARDPQRDNSTNRAMFEEGYDRGFDEALNLKDAGRV